MNKDEFKKHGYKFVDWVADYMDEIEAYPVCFILKPGEVKQGIPLNPPQQGESMENLF